MRLAIFFNNFGPYHLARLRALARRLPDEGGRLLACEVAGVERTYPWQVERRAEPFEWTTLFHERPLESLSRTECAGATRDFLDRRCPDAVAVAGYARPESRAALA